MKYILLLFYLNGDIISHYVNIDNDLDLSKQACEYVGISSLKNRNIGDYKCNIVITKSEFKIIDNILK